MTYYLNISSIKDKSLDIFKRRLPDEIIERIEKMSNKDSRAQSILAWSLFKYVLFNDFKISHFNIILDKNGKPYLKDLSLNFNLSHSENMVVCSISGGNIGVDVQKIAPYSQRISNRFYCENEADFLQKSDCKDYYFTKFWTLKESILKYKGTGISGGLRKYDFSNQPDSESQNIYGLHFKSLQAREYIISVCCENEDEEIYETNCSDFTSFFDIS